MLTEEPEDIIELDIKLDSHIDLDTLNWIPYNPRKDIKRYGCSITSLSGNDNGIPDLDSLIEFNRLNNTKFSERDFKALTKHAYPFKTFLSNFQCGRSHYLKFDSGGFFPWHRDNDFNCFRIIYTVQGCHPNSLVWIEGDKPLHLEDNRWYYVNTKKKHCLFAFDTAILAVFNAIKSNETINKLFNSARIK